jgi:hypothetical protein
MVRQVRDPSRTGRKKGPAFSAEPRFIRLAEGPKNVILIVPFIIGTPPSATLVAQLNKGFPLAVF